MPRLSIRARLISLSALLLAILLVSSTLLTRELANDSQSLAEEARLVAVVSNANLASKHFGDLKYWMTDWAVTQLATSLQNAADAKTLLAADLQAIGPVDPTGVGQVESKVEALSVLAQHASDAYSADDSATGDALMTQVKAEILSVDQELNAIVDRLERQAVTRRDASMRKANSAVELAIAGGILALLAATALTALIVRSIVVPLRRVEQSMAAITRGELDAPIPAATTREMQAMTQTLGMLRDSLIERDRLQAGMRAARDAAEAALRELKATQANLIHAEKMASLGELTAGIAHEIKNPLNFVNNFAALSIELLDELRAAAGPAIDALDAERRIEIDETIGMLTANLDKIAGHGRRADGIVKSMLAHSRETSGDRQRIDLNALVEEALNLAYHGRRAQDRSVEVTIERDFAPGLAPVELVPPDMTRVLLNLLGNGFYAVEQRKRRSGDIDYQPTLRVTTREAGGSLEIRVRDNGPGIPAEIRDKLFQPFFTTKPTGEGTGLGLSISYDVVTKQHGGTLRVESEVGEYAEFIITIPRVATVAGG